MVVVFKPSLKCNIKCKHCYVGDERSNYENMSLQDAVTVLSKIPAGSEVIFHGGEPMLMGLDFYRHLVAKFESKFRFSMQSNLMLAHAGWANFIKDDLNGRISTSFDVVGTMRPVSKVGWMEKLLLLKEYDISPYVVSVLSKENQDHALQMYRFFSSLGSSFRINYVENIGYAGLNGLNSLRHDTMKYAQALIDVFDVWFMNPDANILVDPCAEILSFFLLGSSAKKCPFTSSCAQHLISVNPDGSVFPCGGFDTFHSFRYGNLITQSLDEVLSSSVRFAACERLLYLPEKCQSCYYFPICEGGCRLEAYSYYGDMHRETSMCEEYRMLFSHIERKIDEEKGDMLDWWQSLLNHNELVSKDN